MPHMVHDRAADAVASTAPADLMTGFPPPDDRQVNLSNWQLPSNVRWAFRHMREIIPSKLISRGIAGARPLSAAGKPLGNPPVVRLDASESTVEDIRTPLLVLHIFERDKAPVGFVAKVDQLYGGAISRVLQSGDFTGRKEDTLLLYPPSAVGIERVLLVGVGKREEHTVERLRRAIGVAVRR